MKKIIANVCAMSIVAILFITAVILFTACNKDCNTCEVRPPDATEKIAFNLMDKSIQEEFQIYKVTEEKNYREIILNKVCLENVFMLLKDYCKNEGIYIDNQAFAFTLYYDSPICQTNKVTDEHIKGISVYAVEKNKIKHHLFVRDENSKFNEIKNAHVSIPYITTNHIHFYLENYVFSDPQNRSFITIEGDFAKKVWNDRKKYKTPLRFEVKRSAKAQVPGNSQGDETGFYSCGNPCKPGPGGCVESSQGRGCTSEACWGISTEAILSEANMMEKMFIDLNLMYAFRDDVLYHSDKGEAYIDNYYYLSEEYNGKIGLALAIKSALVLKDFNPVMRAFVNPEEHLKDILFTDDLSTSLLSLLDEYEKITSSSEGKAILASIRKDVHSLKNKQLQEILAMIK